METKEIRTRMFISLYLVPGLDNDIMDIIQEYQKKGWSRNLAIKTLIREAIAKEGEGQG